MRRMHNKPSDSQYRNMKSKSKATFDQMSNLKSKSYREMSPWAMVAVNSLKTTEMKIPVLLVGHDTCARSLVRLKVQLGCNCCYVYWCFSCFIPLGLYRYSKSGNLGNLGNSEASYTS